MSSVDQLTVAKLFESYGGLIALFIVAIVVVFVLKRVLSRRFAYPYKQREALFTPAEKHFLSVLQKAADEDAVVFGKVRVADVLKPWDRLPGRYWYRAFHQISSKHFDYVLCNPHDLFVLCVVELNDSSHENRERRQRDEFLRAACAAADLPLLEFKAKRRYVIREIREKLEPHLI